MSKRRTRGKATPSPLAPLLTAQAAGVVLMALGAVTILSLLSAQSSALLAGWVRLLRRGVGLETVAIPFVFIALGVRLFVGRLGRPGAWGADRTAGAALLGLALSAGLHMALANGDPAGLAARGDGGGAVGWGLSQALMAGVGAVGAWIVVIACTLASVLLLLRVSMSVLVGLAVRLGRQVRSVRNGAGVPDGEPEAPIETPLVVRHAGPPTPVTRPSRPAPHAAERAQPAAPVLAVEAALPHHDWVLPAWEQMLEEHAEKEAGADEIRERVRVIEETLSQFGVPARVVEVNQGPTVTQFGVEPGFLEPKDERDAGRPTKVKVSRISALSNDLSLALSASPIRVEAPVPGRSIVGIEVPNSDPSTVSLRSVVQSEAFGQVRGRLKVALGQDVSGRPVAADLAAMPHLLIAGATGSGKSVCLSAIVASLLLFNTPEDLRLIMADPKRVELSQFGGIPHLLAPVVVDMERFGGMLQWATREMERRYRAFGVVGARNLEGYNEQAKARGTATLPYVVLLVDELADLMLLSPDEVEHAICRIAQMARATGIHLVLATQRPSVDVVTGLIKANFPARIAFAVTSQVDSRVILDMPGAEKLLGRGDMLYMAADTSHVQRLQGCYVSDAELARLVAYWVEAGRSGATQAVAAGVQQTLWAADSDGGGQNAAASVRPAEDPDPLLAGAEREVRVAGRGSIALLQRQLRIGYSRAAGLIDRLTASGVLDADGVAQPPGGNTQGS